MHMRVSVSVEIYSTGYIYVSVRINERRECNWTMMKQFPFFFTYIHVSHHLFGGNSGIDTSYTALMDVHVQFDTLEPSQEEYNGYWRDARENDDGCYGQDPVGIAHGYWFSL